jgi:hypothetical protein
VVPFRRAASDLATRTIAEPLRSDQQWWSRTNGAAGTIDADTVAKAKPDGYTLLGTRRRSASRRRPQEASYDASATWRRRADRLDGDAGGDLSFPATTSGAGRASQGRSGSTTTRTSARARSARW